MNDQEKKDKELKESTDRMRNKFDLLDFGEHVTKVILLISGTVAIIVFFALIIQV